MSVIANNLDLANLLTPTFIVDLNKTKENALFMINKAKKFNVVLRPHVKTHKTIEIAQFQTENESKPITVSTIAELLFYSKAGFENILLAIPITLEKLVYIEKSITSLDSIFFITDSLSASTEIQEWAAKKSVQVLMYIKINSGGNRAGLQPSSAKLLELARFIDSASNLDFVGLLTHAGQSYGFSDEVEKQKVAKTEIQSIVDSVTYLERNGIKVKVRSIGSTPTMNQDVDLDGITEIRPGNYIWYDMFQANRGNCEIDAIACSVLTSIIGVYPERETILIDAGALALSKDVGFWRQEPPQFGLVKHYPDLILISLSQEHGILKANKERCEQFKVGDKLEILPNHSCLTAACFDEYVCVENGEIVGRIKPAKFWA